MHVHEPDDGRQWSIYCRTSNFFFTCSRSSRCRGGTSARQTSHRKTYTPGEGINTGSSSITPPLFVPARLSFVPVHAATDDLHDAETTKTLTHTHTPPHLVVGEMGGRWADGDELSRMIDDAVQCMEQTSYQGQPHYGRRSGIYSRDHGRVLMTDEKRHERHSPM